MDKFDRNGKNISVPPLKWRTQTKSVVKTERLSGYNRGFIPRLAGINGPIDAMFGKNLK